MLIKLKRLTGLIWFIFCSVAGTYFVNWLVAHHLNLTARNFPVILAIWVMLLFLGHYVINWIFEKPPGSLL